MWSETETWLFCWVVGLFALYGFFTFIYQMARMIDDVLEQNRK